MVNRYSLLFTVAVSNFWFLVGLLTTDVSAQVLHLVRYQGQAVDSKGVPLKESHELTFRMYDAETQGNLVWWEKQTSVPLTNGYFSILLGQVTPLDQVDWNKPLWLSTQVDTNSELSPRQRLTSVPYAMVAEQLGNQVYLNGSNVGVGKKNPNFPLEIVGSVDGRTQLHIPGKNTELDRGLYLSSTDPGGVWGGYEWVLSGGMEVTGNPMAGGFQAKAQRATLIYSTGSCDGTLGFGVAPALSVGQTFDVFMPGLTKMVICGTGNVGIGTNNPISRLDVADGDFRVGRPASNRSVKLDINDNEGSAYLCAGGYTTHNQTSLTVTTTGGPDLFVDTTGRVAIGTTQANGYQFYVNGRAYAQVWDFGSSRTLKTDIEPLSSSEYTTLLEQLSQMEVVRFRWKEQAKGETGPHLGIIAEDAPMEITNPDQTAIRAPESFAFLAASLKALKGELDTLKIENQSLKRRIEELESKSK